VNDAPVASNASLTTAEDTAATGTLDATDVDGPALTFAIVTNGTKGTTITNATTGAFTYTPNAHANGTDTFTFKANDGTTDSNIGTVTVTITAVNDAPVATNDTLTTAEDTPAAGTLSASDIDSPALTYSIVANGTKGTAVVTNTATGAFTYTPNPNANGADTFTFKAHDGALDSNIATVTVTITPVNDAPVASNGSTSVAAGASVSGTLVATDVEGPALTYTIVANGTRGTVVLTNAATGAYTYTAGPTAGTDTFTFTASDGTVSSNVATITVTITGGNQPPVAGNGTVTTQEDRSGNGTLQATDTAGTRFTFSIVTSGAKGTATITNVSTGRYTYVPAPNANGTDAFTFRANDGISNSNVGTVSVTITPVNDAPVAANAAVTTQRNQPLNAQLQAVDVDGDALLFSLRQSPRRGSVTISANGSFTYTPNANYTGRDSFTFRVSDGTATATGSVDVTITP
jgi:VCBS repeat-containing protein